jgi:glycosyltransferase involved in cell wall biosynthesis
LEVENGNVQALAGAINRLLEDAALQDTLGNNASKRIQNFFVIKAIKNDIMQLYDN